MAGQERSVALRALGVTIARLKRVPRTGWLLRGVAPGEVESVAAHTCGVGLVALALADLLDEPIDKGRLLSICLLHDLAETVLGDWPGPAHRYLAPGVKYEAERLALRNVLAGLPFADDWQALWQEFEGGTSVEARLARDADRLDLLLQAAAYEAAGRLGLDEFFAGAAGQSWEFAESAELSAALLSEQGRR